MKIIRHNIWSEDLITENEEVKWSYWNSIIPYGKDLICFNTKSGAILLLSKDEYLLYSTTPNAAPIILQRMGVIICNSINEKKEWYKDFKKGRNDETLLDLTIATTMQCQFRCEYCFEGHKSSSKLSSESIECIKKYIVRQTNLRTLHITWFGGEPLLNIDAIDSLSDFFISYCSSNDIQYYADITTNGYGLTKQLAHHLIHDCNIKRYIITIDGPENIHNQRRPLRNGNSTFETIWKNIIHIIRESGMVTIRVTVDKKNQNQISKLIDFIANSDIKDKVGLVFVKTFDFASTPDNIHSNILSCEDFAKLNAEYIRYAHDRGVLEYATPRPCPKGGCLRKGDITIGADGNVYKCLDTLDERKWIVGHIPNPIDNREDWYLKWLNWTPNDDDNCRNCVLLPLCNGGCPHNALFTEKKHGNKNHCPDWKTSYENIMKLYVEDKITKQKYEEV